MCYIIYLISFVAISVLTCPSLPSSAMATMRSQLGVVNMEAANITIEDFPICRYDPKDKTVQQLKWLEHQCKGVGEVGICPHCGIHYTHQFMYFIDTDDDAEDVQPRPLLQEEQIAIFMYRHTGDVFCWRYRYPLLPLQMSVWDNHRGFFLPPGHPWNPIGHARR